MNRAVHEAIGFLRARSLLSPEQGALLGRLTRGELFSLRIELQATLWAGVTLIAGGAGLLVKEHLSQLGPLTIGAGIALVAALCLGYVVRAAPPYSRAAVPSPTLAFDYALLLGVLLVGTDLAWLEKQLAILGPAWPRHLLLLALLQLTLAFRYDSRLVLSLALASFAAWRGLSLSLAGANLLGTHGAPLRLNAMAVGALYVGTGALLRRADHKAHFEPTFVNVGLLLLLGAAVAGVFGEHAGAALPWGGVLAAAAAATILLAWRARRSDCFAQGVIAALLGVLRLISALHLAEIGFLLVSMVSFGALSLILLAHRRFREAR